MNKSKILAMIAAAELQLEELKFDPRQFLAELKQEVKELSLFEFSSEVNNGQPMID